jgi:site-specific DNA recombinase
MARADLARTGSTIRCAIYTRKSSDEGLEQEFNSLDAQREACEAYIVSQRHAGWIAHSDMYDDGGLSGGTMERPALKRLLEEVKASKVQTVVVYKVDRLTRALSDFAKLVDVFDRRGVSFVSITQQFNTTTSISIYLNFDLDAPPRLNMPRNQRNAGVRQAIRHGECAA